MKKKIITICLVFAIILSSSIFANANNYEDIAGHWAEESIYTWSDRGIINGVGNKSFAPDNDMTRAEAATVFAKLFKLEEKADISAFSDVASNAWYKDALEKCVAAGIIVGEGSRINPDGKITREMFFTMLVRALNIETENTLNKQINDENSISDWAKESVYTLVNNGYVNGLGDNTIAPKNNINRASVITLIDRLVVNYAAHDNSLLKSHDKGISLVLADNVKTEKGFSGTILVKKDKAQLLLSGASSNVKVIVVTDDVTVKNAANGIEVKVSENSKNVTVNGEIITAGSTVNVKTQVIVSGGVSSGGGIHSHSYTEAVATKATCLADGLKTYTCRCGNNYTEVIPKLSDNDQHTEGTPVKENVVAESCTSAGTYDEVVYCSVCEEELSRTPKTSDMIGHTPATAVIENEVAGTCEVKGTYDEVVYCSVCGNEISRTEKTTDFGTHTPATAVVENEVAGTCEVKGTYDEVVYCSVCCDEISRTEKTSGFGTHTPATAVVENEVAGTCVVKGTYDEVVYCSVCGDEMNRTEKTSDFGTHTPATAVTENEVAGTCEVKGTYDEVVYCSVCGNEISRTEKTTDFGTHTPATAVVENEVAGTCVVKGTYDEVVYCSVCGDEMNRTEKTSDFGTHTPATAVIENEVAGTCEVKGTYDEVVYCSVCGDEISRTENITDFGTHKYVDGSCEYCGEDEPITEPAIRISKVVANAGDTVDVTVSVVNNPGIFDMILSFTYDSNAMALKSVTNGEVMGDATFMAPKNMASGCRATWYYMDEPAEYTDGSVVVLTFDISDTVSEGEYVVNVAYDNGDINSYDGDPLSFVITEGVVTVR